MATSESHVRSILVNLFNRLKVLGNEDDFNKSLDEIITFVGGNNVPPEILGEVLAAFTIERCDNILANIAPTDSSVRANVHRLAAEALKLYLYSTTRITLLEDDSFAKYILELSSLRIEADTREDLQRKLLEEASTHMRKVLKEDAERLAETAIVDSVDTLESLLPTIRRALENGKIKLLIVPSTAADSMPLFFKNYYIPHNDREKVKRTVIAIYRVIRSLKPFLKPNTHMHGIVEAMEKTVRNILGAEPLDKFIEQKREQAKTGESNKPTEAAAHEDLGETITYIEALEPAKLEPIIRKVLENGEHTIHYRDTAIKLELYEENRETYIRILAEDKKPQIIKLDKDKPKRTAKKLVKVLRHITKT